MASVAAAAAAADVAFDALAAAVDDDDDDDDCEVFASGDAVLFAVTGLAVDAPESVLSWVC